MADARFDKSEKAIKEAFVRLSGEIGVSRFGMTQLAREARVSRSTLYGHFRNTEEVFEALVDDFAEGLKPLEAHLHEGCAACPTVPKPFCVAVRESVELRPLLRDPRFCRCCSIRSAKRGRPWILETFTARSVLERCRRARSCCSR